MAVDTGMYSSIKGPDLMSPAQVVSLQNVAQQGQLQKVQLEEAQQNQVKKNMLREIMQGATDPKTGRLTPEGLGKITAIDPEMGLNLGGQQERLRMMDVARNEKKDALLAHVGTAYVSSYDRYLQQTGGNKEQATQLAQKETQELINQLDSSGSLASQGFDTETVSKLRQLRDPEQTRTIVTGLGGKIPESAPTNRQERKRISGVNEIQEEWDPSSKSWRKIGEGPRFAGTSEEGKAPAGYRFSKTKPGELEPIPGGPAAHPSGLSAEYNTNAEYKKGVDFWANLLKDGGSLPPRFAQSGSGKKMLPDILNVVPTLGNGDSKGLLANQVDLTGQKSEARAVGTKAANVEMAAGEAREMMPILQETSENFKRTGYQPINQVFKNFQDKTGSVESRQFGAALNSFVNVYARAVSPSGVPTVSDKDHAREVLSTADSHEQLLGLLKVLDKEMVAAQNAPKRVREAQRAGITGETPPSHGPETTAPTGRGGAWDSEKERRYQEFKKRNGG